MGTACGDGLAVDNDVVRAAERAADAAISPLGATPDLVCVFISAEDPDAATAAARRVAALCGEETTLLGCTSGGVIGAGRGVEGETAVSVWAARLPGVRMRAFHLEVMRAPTGTAIIGLPDGDPGDGVTLLFADAYSFPAVGFVDQLNAELAGATLVGGLATGPGGPGSTRLFLDRRAADRGAVGVTLSGAVPLRPLVSQGCRPVGPTMVVTKADGSHIFELAGRPALEKLEEIVSALGPGESALAAEGLRLGVVMDEYAEDHGRGDFLVRTVVGADQSTGALVVGDVVEVGRTVRFQLSDAEGAGDDLRRTVRELREDPSYGDIAGALLVTCHGRGRKLFGNADHDVQVATRALGTPHVAGFFAAGEIGPAAGQTRLHTFSASLLAVAANTGVAGSTPPATGYAGPDGPR